MDKVFVSLNASDMNKFDPIIKNRYRIYIDSKLEAIEIFLKKNLKSVDTEIATIYKKDKAGKFPGLDDIDNALFIPTIREKITIKAVLYEINAIVEWELYYLANKPYREKKFEKFIHEVNIAEICKLIEEYHKINLSDLQGFVELRKIREIVNSLKHLNGIKNPRKSKKIGERFELTRDMAWQAINSAKIFLEMLYEKPSI